MLKKIIKPRVKMQFLVFWVGTTCTLNCKRCCNLIPYSEEQKADYFSQYRCLKKEIEILENVGSKNIEIIDIYPPEANRWSNTHFYAIVGEK